MYSQFTINERVRFTFPNNDMPIAELKVGSTTAKVSLYGAQVLSFTLLGQDDLLWLSPNAVFASGKAIRGGIPVCWPWFGAHTSDTSLPAHGFARISLWSVHESKADKTFTELTLSLIDDDATHALFPFRFEVRLTIHLTADKLRLTLTTLNRDDQAMPLSEALHTYFAVADVQQCQIAGLQGCEYSDKLDNWSVRTEQAELLEIKQPTDRVYAQQDGALQLIDKRLKRQILIEKSQSGSTIVWNPGEAVAASMSDVGAAYWSDFVCIESGNALHRSLSLAPGESHSLVSEYSATAL